MKVAPNNVIPGSKIMFKEESHFVYKVNDKSIYIGKATYESLKPILEVKKIIDAIVYVGGFKVLYGEDLQIKESDIVHVSAKEVVKQKRFLDLLAEREIKRLYGNYKSKNGKSYKHICFIGNKEFKIISCNESEQVLISCEGNLFFYDVGIDVYTYFKSVYDTSIPSNPIPWPIK